MPQRIPALDGLRGCAILLVLLFHADVLFGGEFPGGGGRIVSLVMGAGWVGVDLFFVLSGFLITGLLLEAKQAGDRRNYFVNFYARRGLRILPLYYGFLVLYLLLPASAWVNNHTYRITGGDKASLFFFYYNFRCAFSQLAIPNLHMFWSLCVEEHFYLFWPLVVWLSPARRLMRICAGMAVISLACRLAAIQFGLPFPVAYLTTPCRLDGLAAGAFLALAARDPAVWQWVSRAARPAAAVSAAGLLGIALVQGHFKDLIDFRLPHDAVSHDSSLGLTFGITGVAVFFGSVLALTLTVSKPWTRLMSWAPLASIGTFSYAMYVFHRLLLHISDFAGRFFIPGYDQFPPALAKPLFAVWLTAFTYAAARLSYRYYERRFLALKRFFPTS